jgi:hypothetical protein
MAPPRDLPRPDPAILTRKARIVARLRAMLLADAASSTRTRRCASMNATR